VRWRYDPAQAGVSAQFADCGIHALHMASFVTGQEVELSADTVSCIPAASSKTTPWSISG
jgi:predicted dehydrogenase